MSVPAHRASEQPKVIVLDEQSPELELRRWPLRDEPTTATIVLAVLLLISTGIGFIGGSIWWGVASAFALLVSQWRMWLPVEFRFSELGVVQSCLRRTWRIRWDHLRGYEVHNDGVLLLPDEQNLALARLKGIYVPFGHEREELLEIIAHYLDDRSE